MGNAELRKKQIFDASIKLFAQKGFYGTFVEEIIKEAKVGKGTFYRNFKNKEDLFIALLQKFLIEWRQSVSIGMANFNIDTYTLYIKEIIMESFQFFRRNDVLSILYFRIAPGLNETIEPMLKNFEKQIERKCRLVSTSKSYLTFPLFYALSTGFTFLFLIIFFSFPPTITQEVNYD